MPALVRDNERLRTQCEWVVLVNFVLVTMVPHVWSGAVCDRPNALT